MNQPAKSKRAPTAPFITPAPWYLNPVIWFLFLAAATTAWVSWSAFEYPMAAFRFGSDYWEHSAAIAEWKKNLWNPGNPHLPIDVGTPRYMPFFFLLTVISNWFSLNPIEAMAVGATINMFLLSIGVWLFFSRYFRNDWAPLVGFVVLTCGWGLGWIFSNLFQLRDLFFVASYPSLFVFSLCLIAFWHVSLIARNEIGGAGHYVALALLTALALISHPLTGAFGLGTMLLLAIFEPGAHGQKRVVLAISILSGALLTELWPYFSTWEVIAGRSGGEAASWVERGASEIAAAGTTPEAMRPRVAAREHGFYDPLSVVLALGPALLGLPAMWLLSAKRQHLFIVVGFIGATAIYLLNLFFPVPLGHRFLLFGAVYLQLALTWWILSTAPAWNATFIKKQRGRGNRIPVLVTGTLLGAMFCWNTAIAALQFGGFQALPKRGILARYTYLQPVLQDMRIIADALPENAVVVGDPWILWPLPTFRGKTVALYHVNPMVPDHTQRKTDIGTFLRTDTSRDTRLAIADKYGITHILYRKKMQEEIAADLDTLGNKTFTHKGYVLIQLHENGSPQK